MLTAKGYRAALWLKNDDVDILPAGAMLHDETGADWPKTSVLFAPFSRLGGDVIKAADDKLANEYFGYAPRAGRFELPPIAKRNWAFVDEVQGIDYYRPGDEPAISNSFFDFLNAFRIFTDGALRPERNLRHEYEHEFKGGWLIFKTGWPMLFRLRQRRNGKPIYRLEMPPWSKINWRGFVRP